MAFANLKIGGRAVNFISLAIISFKKLNSLSQN
jgi:hypothetical protein